MYKFPGYDEVERLTPPYPNGNEKKRAITESDEEFQQSSPTARLDENETMGTPPVVSRPTARLSELEDYIVVTILLSPARRFRSNNY